VKFSPLIYQAMLRLYPEDLQRDFGEDMADAFTEELLRAWRERGVFRKAAAMAGVWYCAASELVTIAIPAKLASPAVGARVMSVALHLVVMGGALALAAVHDQTPVHIWHGLVELHLKP
jgi:hypothetical protein